MAGNPRNKWLLIQLGANNRYHVSAFTNRQVAMDEGERTLKLGIPYRVANLDDFMSPEEESREELALEPPPISEERAALLAKSYTDEVERNEGPLDVEDVYDYD